MSSLPLLLALVARLTATPASAPLARLAGDTVTRDTDSVPTPRLTIVFGAGAPQVTTARGFDFTMAADPALPRRGSASARAQVHFLRAPDSLSAELARRVTAGERYARVDLTVQRGASVIAFHLHDVRVLSTHVRINIEDAALAKERLALQESLAQLAAQEAEAHRQLVALEALARDRLSPPLDLARARSDAEVVQTRLAMQRERLSLLDIQQADWMPAQEEVVLDAARAEVEVRAP